MSGFGTTPMSTTTLGANQFPVSAVAVPNEPGGNLTALEGGPETTDGNGNKTAPASMYIKDGGNVAQGTTTDAAYSGSGAGTEISILKKLVALLSATLAVSGTITANAGVNLNTSGLAVESGGHLASIDTHTPALGQTTMTASSPVVIASNQSTIPTLDTNSTAIKTDLDTIVTNTNKIPASPAQESGNLATIAGAISSGKMATKAANGDFAAGSVVDLATLLTLAGTPSDANTVTSFMGRFTKIRDLLAATLTVQQNDLTATGSITAAQPTQDTPVVSATIVLTLGTGNSSWAVDLRGTFSAGTTINFDGTINGTNWFGVNAVPFGSTSDTEVQSVVGGAPLQYQGNASGLQKVRIRASALQGGDSVTVTLISSVSTDGGFLTKALPPGSAVIGGVTANAGTNLNTSLLALESGGNLASVASNTANIPTKGQATMANSSPVVIASNQSNVPTNIAQINSQTPTLDNTTIIATSMRGKGAGTAGDTAVKLNSVGDQYVVGDFVEQSGLSAGALNADLVPATDVSGSAWLSLHITAVASGATLTFQASNDNFASQIENVNLARVSSSTTVATTATTTGIFEGPINFRYFRVRQTAWISGTTTGVLELFSVPRVMNTAPSSASQAGTWTVQPGNVQNTTPWLTAGPTANAVQAANTAGNVVVKGTPGYLWTAVVTTLGTAQLDIFDNATTNSGTKLLSIPASAAVGSIYSFPGGGRASAGITSAGVTNCPGVTFYYS